ncbi:hypothetical protein [Thiohalorhabdus sp.]|uniref:hypothetical protein n=1 Tax=Thiohalorhabdus sp. TaxID=3094134 RepID=UPI002FC34240
MTTATIGPVATSTDNADLIPALMDELADLEGRPVEWASQRWPNLTALPATDEWWESAAAEQLREELAERLDELAPLFCRFEERDTIRGTMYGFFPDMERIQEGEDIAHLTDSGHHGAGLELDGEPAPDGEWVPMAEYRLFVLGIEKYRHVAYVNDHGNLDVYEWHQPEEYRLLFSAV